MVAFPRNARTSAALLFLAAVALLLLEQPRQSLAARAQQPLTSAAQSGDRPLNIPTDQIIVRFLDTADLSTVTRAQQMQIERTMSQAAGVELQLLRPMSGGAYVFKLPGRANAPEMARINRALAAEPAVLYAEPDRILQADGREQAPVALPDGVGATPNDSFYDKQWHYHYTPGSEEGVNLPAAWDITTGSSATVVAVIDTGVLQHAELKDSIIQGYDFIGAVWNANDGDGRDSDASDPGDWVPANYCGAHRARDSSWHGTHVSGTIAAASNNNKGVAGINWKAKILPVRVLGRCGGYTSDILDGARWAAGLSVPGVPKNNNAADVINLSLGGYGACSAAQNDAFAEITAAGTAVVASAGNSNADAADFSPGNCKDVITVAATNRSGDRSYYSNYGSTVEISAPGGAMDVSAQDGILSTLNSGATDPVADIYAYYQGTSMAAPHAAGVLSLLAGQSPGLSVSQLLERIQTTARSFPAGSSCSSSKCGAGIIDAAAALADSAGETLEAPVIAAIANDGVGSFTVAWSAVAGAEWYKIKENHDNTVWANLYEGPLTYVQRQNLAAGEYCYRVRAFNSETVSDWSADLCADVNGGQGPTTTPTATSTSVSLMLQAPVINDILNADGDGNFAVGWSAVAGAEWYKIKENHNNTVWANLYEGPLTYVQRENLANGEYCYHVRAFNSETVSDWSADRCTVVNGGQESTETPTATSTPTATATIMPTAAATVTATATLTATSSPPPTLVPTDFAYVPVASAP